MSFSFYVILTRFLLALAKGIKRDPEFRALLFFMIILLIGATIFYMTVEKWSLVDAVYFSVMTMSTIGYGDLAPSSDQSKIFTILFSLMSIGVFVSVVGKIMGFSVKHGHHHGKDHAAKPHHNSNPPPESKP